MTAREIDAKIFSLRNRVNAYLGANDVEKANELLDRIAALEGEKQNAKPKGNHDEH